VRGRRGSSLLLALLVLTLFALVLGTVVQLGISDLEQTRRRMNAAYASELARSGTDWALATLVAGQPVPRTVLPLAGGEIEVHVENLPEGGRRIVSEGRVTVSGAVLATREERVDIGAGP